MKELWDAYSKDRKRTGNTCVRGKQEHLRDDEYHLWVMVWIKNSKTGKYLVSQRAATKHTDPLKWETVAGHVIFGETSRDAAVREVFEEVGINLKPEDGRILATKIAGTYRAKRHNWIRDSFYFETTDEPDLVKATTPEVLQTKWLTVAEIKDMYDRGECCLNMGDIFGFVNNPVPEDHYQSVIGKVVKGKIDRPVGSAHPDNPALIYPINYGFIEGVPGGDGEEQDIYLLGGNAPIQEFIGKVIAVYHRYDDSETKWIVIPCDENGNISNEVTVPSNDEIYAMVAFQEQFYSGVLVN